MAEEAAKKCLVCGKGDIVANKTLELIDHHLEDLIGYRFKDEDFHPVINGYYCNVCGIMYKFLPKE